MPTAEEVREAVIRQLTAAGCVAADEEADELLEAAAGDDGRLRALVDRRLTGQPLAWITGWAPFCGHRIRVLPGVYVPRWQSEHLARRAVAALPPRGHAVDLCTGSGAIAATLQRARPDARVVATDIDPLACTCARENGVEVYPGSLDEPLPTSLRGRCDVVTAVTPYVPSAELVRLPRDVREHEPPHALDGGPDGSAVLSGAAAAAARLLGPGGIALLELGGDEDEVLIPLLETIGFGRITRHLDEDGDLRALDAVRLG